MKLGDVLVQYRMEHNYSIREFAKICGLSPAQILFMERGTNSQGNPFVPKVKSLKKVADGMGITFGELVAICDDNLVIGWDDDDMTIPDEKMELINMILKATPSQVEKIKSVLALVMQ